MTFLQSCLITQMNAGGTKTAVTRTWSSFVSSRRPAWGRIAVTFLAACCARVICSWFFMVVVEGIPPSMFMDHLGLHVANAVITAPRDVSRALAREFLVFLNDFCGVQLKAVLNVTARAVLAGLVYVATAAVRGIINPLASGRHSWQLARVFLENSAYSLTVIAIEEERRVPESAVPWYIRMHLVRVAGCCLGIAAKWPVHWMLQNIDFVRYFVSNALSKAFFMASCQLAMKTDLVTAFRSLFTHIMTPQKAKCD